MSQRQIPRGSESLVCPFHKATMDTVCHKCPLWQHVRGMNPNTGAEIDRWDCAVAFLPILLIEAAKEARGASAATESFRNEMVRRHDEARAIEGAALGRLGAVALEGRAGG